MGTVDDTKLYDFSEDEIIEVRKKFPKLSLISKGAWEGDIDIDAVYSGNRITDTFKIGILAPNTYPDELPIMIELGNRTETIAEKYHLADKRDLHYNIQSQIACLCVKQEEKVKFPPGSNLVTFIDNLVVPYLYGLSFYDQNGKWPWGEYSHGSLGLLEYYAKDISELTKTDIEKVAKIIVAEPNWKDYSKQIQKPSPKRSCLCCSGNPIKKCHPEVWKGIVHLSSEITRLGLDPYEIYKR